MEIVNFPLIECCRYINRHPAFNRGLNVHFNSLSELFGQIRRQCDAGNNRGDKDVNRIVCRIQREFDQRVNVSGVKSLH